MDKRQKDMDSFVQITAKQFVLNIIIPLTYMSAELHVVIFQSPLSCTVLCRCAVLCHPSWAHSFPCRTDWFDSNHPFQSQTIR